MARSELLSREGGSLVCACRPSDEDLRQKLTAIAQTAFGVNSVRDFQLDAAMAMLRGEDLVCAVPTGGGKSLVFQLAALATRSPSATFVFEPLVSLIADQTERLLHRKINAVALSADVLLHRGAELQRCESSALIYLTPEFLESSSECRELVRSLAKDGKLFAFVIDEAHTVLQWGQDWRPACLQLCELRKLAKLVPIACFSATLSTAARADLQAALGLNEPTIIARSINRANISYEVRAKQQQAREQLLKILCSEFPNVAFIVYVHGRDAARELQEFLEEHDVACEYYHSDMQDCAKAAVPRNWQRGKTRGVVATVAFGMGIDKSDARLVVHYNLPASPEHYVQESGRVGRDGQPATAIVLFSSTDWHHRLAQLFSAGTGTIAAGQSPAGQLVQRQKQCGLAQMVAYCELQGCLRSELLRLFEEKGDSCSQLDSQACSGCTAFKQSHTRNVTQDICNLASLATSLGECGVQPTPSELLQLFCGRVPKSLAIPQLDSVAGFAVGASFGVAEARRVLHLAEAHGLIERRPDKPTASALYGTWRMRPTAKVHSLIARRARSETATTVQLTVSARAKTVASERKQSVAASATDILRPAVHKDYERVFAALIAWRDGVCEQMKTPAVAILSDDALLAIALRQPATASELACVFGVGSQRTERFGAAVLREISLAVDSSACASRT